MEKLLFRGPFTFHTVPTSDLADAECIYIWTFRQFSGDHLIHYIGETANFAKRQREHLASIFGLYYGIWDGAKALEGNSIILWPGFWRLKGGKDIGDAFTAYSALNRKILEYANSITIFAAQTSLEQSTRKHIEGTIAWTLRNSFPEHKKFYPVDNRTGRKPEKLGMSTQIQTKGNILGLPHEIAY